MRAKAVFFCNMAGYKGCEIAYNDCEDWLEELLPILDHNRRVVEDFMAEHFPQIKVMRLEGTYLQWLDCRGLGLTYKELEAFMTQEHLSLQMKAMYSANLVNASNVSTLLARPMYWKLH